MVAAKRQTPEAKIEALSAFAPNAGREALNATLQKALEDRHFRVVAKAATLVGERSLHERVKDLIGAYGRFLDDPIKRDPNCIAKQAIVRALVALDCHDVNFYLAGIRYRQLEPVWGGTADTAIDVRCSCAMGLAASGYTRAVQELTELLNDSEARARSGAARAISCCNPHEAEALLRFKVLIGDKEPEVIGECFTALLAIAAEASLPLVAQYLSAADAAIADLAALALGESRHPAAIGYLRAAWDEVYVPEPKRAVLIRAAALHRTEPAFEWLLGVIENGKRSHTDIAVDALAVYERNTRLAERVRDALEKRGKD
jgi:HEAT repeat protein